ncbi:MAG TPA: hypothetical protein VLE97_05815 [Gaiellaceae bacterium]|nr:hypothetical protein [Gaiellaceae bacterium]
MHPYYGYAVGQAAAPAPFGDAEAEHIVNIWKAMFPDAAILPVIGYPSQSKGVMTMTHTGNIAGMPPMPPMTINGIPSNSPLANNALYSTELAPGGWLNLYEIMVPDVPGKNGAPSLGTRYKNALQSLGVDVDGDHFHWAGGEMQGKFARAIHSRNFGMHPADFTQRQLQAFMAAFGHS